VDLVRQDVILERILEDHDVVIGRRTANQCRHPYSLVLLLERWIAANAARRPPAAWPEGTTSLLLDLVLDDGGLVRLLPAELVTAEVAVRGRLLVDGTQEVEHLQDAVRTQVEVLVHGRDDLILGHLVRAEGLDGHGS